MAKNRLFSHHPRNKLTGGLVMFRYTQSDWSLPLPTLFSRMFNLTVTSWVTDEGFTLFRLTNNAQHVVADLDADEMIVMIDVVNGHRNPDSIRSFLKDLADRYDNTDGHYDSRYVDGDGNPALRKEIAKDRVPITPEKLQRFFNV